VLTGKKVGDAVIRNRQRRWAREAFRRARALWPSAGCVIIRFHQQAQSYEQVQRAILEAYQLAFQRQHPPD